MQIPIGPKRAKMPPRADGLVLVAALAFALGTALRFGSGLHEPLWIDETFTGAIAAQPDLAGLLHQVWADVNAPFYYAVMFAWARIAGVSNLALHLPSAVFATLAAALALRGGSGLDRRTCLVWGTLLGLWPMGLAQASEARCYALLLLLATAAVLAFARLLAAPTRGNALLWAGLSALAVLTHYYALPVVAAQGGMVLWRHRSRALPLWPALLAFLPVLGWIGFHAVRLAAFAQPDIAWQPPLAPESLPGTLLRLLGLSTACLLPAVLLLRAWFRVAPPADADADAATSAALAALIALALVLAVGMLRPSFSLRYCVPCIPGLLLGLAALVRATAQVRPALPALVLAVAMLPAPLGTGPVRGYSFETASASIAEAGARRLVFLWDHPSSPVGDPAQMRAVGGFFLARAGHPIPVESVINPWREDPNPRLLAAAGAQPGSAILWLYDQGLPKTAARTHPPRIAQIDPAWRCRDHAGDRYAALVCLREAGTGEADRRRTTEALP